MRSHLRRATVFVLYQMSLLAGILLFPVALVLKRVGLTLPVHRLVDRFNAALSGEGRERVDLSPPGD